MKIRIYFENSTINADIELANDNLNDVIRWIKDGRIMLGGRTSIINFGKVILAEVIE